jgi:hypothetical protein
MAENIRCTYCRAALRLPDQFIGQEVRCPSCQKTFTARPPATPSPPPPEPPERDEPPTPRRRPRDDEEDDNDPLSRRRANRSKRSYRLGDRSGIVLALGITSVVFIFLSCIVAVIAVIVPVSIIGVAAGVVGTLLGRGDLAAIRNGDRDPAGEGMTNAGFICSIIGLIVNGIILLLQCGVGVIAAVMFVAAH